MKVIEIFEAIKNIPNENNEIVWNISNVLKTGEKICGLPISPRDGMDLTTAMYHHQRGIYDMGEFISSLNRPIDAKRFTFQGNSFTAPHYANFVTCGVDGEILAHEHLPELEPNRGVWESHGCTFELGNRGDLQFDMCLGMQKI